MKDVLRLRWMATVGMLTGLLAAPAAPAHASTGSLGALTGLQEQGNTYTVSSGAAAVRLVFYSPDVFRIWLAPDGTFTDPAGGELTPGVGSFSAPGTRLRDDGSYYAIATRDLVVRVYKQPITFALYRSDGVGPVWQESQPLSWTDSATTQTLAGGGDQQFFGGGMQNGTLGHRGATLQIARQTSYGDGSHPNPSPFYLSTAGYGVFRNTFTPGTYAFNDPVTATHQEQRFDAFYFYGPDPKRVLNEYTQLTGRPFMPPIYGMEMGLSDCYNEQGRTTPDALGIADQYVASDMPLGYSIVNDDYQCGYTDLPDVGAGLRQRDIQLGLWTSTGLPNQQSEVSQSGVRVYKLDGAWTLPGYQAALDDCEQAYQGIENNSDARGFIWTIFGWTGTQRCGVMWTGDQTSSWDNIQWHIPTIAADTMSGMAFTSSDLDGFYSGSPPTYTRDLEWKSFLPMFMALNTSYTRAGQFDGKQPWAMPEPYQSIDRDYLHLHQQLLPYLYTYAAQAHRDGVGPVRPLYLEFPSDPNTWNATAEYEFLSGSDFLVAPVYADTTVRDGIYLPKGATWADYHTGRLYNGGQTINGYPAPIGTLPLFVKGGAIIPMAPYARSWNLIDQNILDLDIYPQGNTSFNLYQDDGVTRAYQHGASSNQVISCSAPQRGSGNVDITIGPNTGQYTGKPAARSYDLTVHTGSRPGVVKQGTQVLPPLPSKAAFDAAASGWYYDPADRGGVVSVKTTAISAANSASLSLHGASAIGGR